MTAVAGLRGTGDFGPDERPKDFREGILFFNPNGEAPIFALTARAGKRVVKDPEFAWWCEGNALVRMTTTGTAISATDTMLTVTPGLDPTATSLGANYASATNLKPGDILMLETSPEVATYAPELVEVDNVLSDTQLVVKRGVAGSTAIAYGSGLVNMTLIGSSYAEGTGAPKAVSRNPVKFFNYTQIFKNTYELSGTADKTTFRTGDPWSNDKKRKAYDHSRDIELAILFGRRSETTGDNGKPKRTFGGLRTFIPASNTKIYTAAVTSDQFLTDLAPVFDFNTGAGDTRVMFCGSTFALELGKIMNSITQVRINSTERVKVYGIDFQEMLVPQGRVMLKTHPLMSRHPVYTKSAFVLDFDAIKWAPLTGRDTKAKDDVQTEDEDVRRGFFQTEAGIEVDYGGLTMAYFGNMSKT
jgi:hypothetical protein